MYGHTVKYPPGDCKDTKLVIPFNMKNGLELIKQKVNEEEVFKIIIPNKFINNLNPVIVDKLQILGSNQKSRLCLHSPHKD